MLRLILIFWPILIILRFFFLFPFFLTDLWNHSPIIALFFGLLGQKVPPFPIFLSKIPNDTILHRFLTKFVSHIAPNTWLFSGRNHSRIATSRALRSDFWKYSPITRFLASPIFRIIPCFQKKRGLLAPFFNNSTLFAMCQIFIKFNKKAKKTLKNACVLCCYFQQKSTKTHLYFCPLFPKVTLFLWIYQKYVWSLVLFVKFHWLYPKPRPRFRF